MESLSLKNITTTYEARGKRLPVLENVSLEVAAGSFASIIGPSGSGKSTILKIAAGLLTPDQGKVFISGKDLTGKERLVGYMPQKDLLLPWKTLQENAALPLIIAGKSRSEAFEEVKTMLPQFGLEGFENYYPAQLSGGMRQRVALFRTLLIDSGLALLDEPFASLDALTRALMQDWILDIFARFKRTTLFVTHSIDEAVYLSDFVYVISQRPGRIKARFAVNLPRPRHKSITHSAAFQDLKEAVTFSLG